MPRLVNSFLRIKLNEKKARELLSERFKERGWGIPAVRELKLLFLPRYYFEYCIASEGGEGKKIVSDFSTGKGFLNPETKELILGEQINKEELSKEFNENVEFKVLKSSIDQENAKKVAAMLLSKEKKASRESIEFLSFNLFFTPFWSFDAEVENKRFEIEINAFSGEVKELSPIPVKQAPWSQAVNETISDLKKPENWLVYSGQVLSFFFRAVKALISNRFIKGFFRALWKSRNVQLLLLLAILFALLYFALVGW